MSTVQKKTAGTKGEKAQKNVVVRQVGKPNFLISG